MAESGIITKQYVHTVIRERRTDIHKGDCGRILVIAGSEGMAGAAVLCGSGAYRAGAGLVRIAVPKELFPIVQTALPEATCMPRSAISGTLSQYDAIAVGPGLGVNEEGRKLLKTVLAEYGRGVIVLDADALNTAAEYDMAEEIRMCRADVILTPHMGEAKRLLSEADKLSGGTQTDTRIAIAAYLAKKFRAVAVLKGSGTVVAVKQDETYINSTGNAGMATGGSGDVLTGVIAGLCGQGIPAADAAKAGVFLHGLAGDLGSAKYSEHGLLAGDIAREIGPAIRSIVGK